VAKSLGRDGVQEYVTLHLDQVSIRFECRRLQPIVICGAQDAFFPFAYAGLLAFMAFAGMCSICCAG
jgi:hypothetical protein